MCYSSGLFLNCYEKYRHPDAFDMLAVGVLMFLYLTVQNCPTAPLNEDFFKAMSDMNLAGGSDRELDFLPLMQGMMQNLLSKDILYPALNDLKEKVI